MMMMMMETAV